MATIFVQTCTPNNIKKLFSLASVEEEIARIREESMPVRTSSG